MTRRWRNWSKNSTQMMSVRLCKSVVVQWQRRWPVEDVWAIPNKVDWNCLYLTVNWLDHGRTLREQGVEETEMLLLRRKFFYSDQNVDSRDPVQLNLLYVQVLGSVVSTHNSKKIKKGLIFTLSCVCVNRLVMTFLTALTLSPLTKPATLLVFSVRSSLVTTMSPNTRRDS